MNTKQVVKIIINKIGGSDNIKSYTHCATRLRFNIKDGDIINKDELNSLKEILGIAEQGGQFQLIIGPDVEVVYNELCLQLSNKSYKDEDAPDVGSQGHQSKYELLNSVMGYVSGSIQPTLPVLIGAGMINSVLAVSVLFGLDKGSGTYITWSSLANIGFAYLPVFVAFSAAKKVRTNEYISAVLALIMIVVFNQHGDMSMLDVAIPSVKYANSIVPVLLMVPVLLWVDRYASKIVPSAAHFTAKPLVLMLIMVPVILFVAGPIGALIGGALADMCIWLMNTIGSLSMAVLSALHPITVMFGMHYLFTPIMINEVAETGFSFVLIRALAANFAMAGAALAVGVKARNIENKSIGYSSCVTALLSVTEPALYGCLIRLRMPLISACIAAGITGIFLGVFKVKAYVIASPCLLSLPIFIGGESMTNFIMACIGAAMGFGLGFVITYLLGFKEDIE
jgi:beta-glucoside PTS system EIICBA component